MIGDGREGCLVGESPNPQNYPIFDTLTVERRIMFLLFPFLSFTNPLNHKESNDTTFASRLISLIEERLSNAKSQSRCVQRETDATLTSLPEKILPRVLYYHRDLGQGNGVGRTSSKH